MRMRRLYSLAVCLTMLVAMVAMPVFANSSWRWLSDTRPYDLLPIAVVMTLVIEILAINYIPRVNNLKTTGLWVILGNLISFGATYFIPWIAPGAIYTYEEMLEHTPFYNIGILSVLLTLFAELPLVYCMLRRKADPELQNILPLTIVIVNILTTTLVYFMERALVPGQW